MKTFKSNSKVDPSLRFNMYAADNQHFVNVTKAGSTITATPTTRNKLNRKNTTVPYDKDHRVNVETGEISPVKHSKHGSHFQNIYRTVSKINGLALNNFNGDPNEVFITLTYADSTNHKLPSDKDVFTPALEQSRQNTIRTIGNDLNKYLNRLKYYFKSLGTEIGYIVLIQPHASGQVHFHLLIKTMNGSAINPNSQRLNNLWSLGMSDIKDVKHINNIAAYLSATMLNNDVDPNEPDKPTKRARIAFYPTGMHIYHASKNLAKPKKEVMTYPDLDNTVNHEKPDFISQTTSELDGTTYNHLRATWENVQRPSTPEKNHKSPQN